MDPARWKRVEEIFRTASERESGARAAFLAAACAEDEELRREVESLLAQPSAGGMLDRSPWAPAADSHDMPSDMTQPAVGQRVGHYEIQAKLGEGGMGAVYRAYDTKLRRLVALKILPPEYAADPERRSRLLREARAASALNHPNIVGIHEAGSDNGVDFIAMELVEGKSLNKIIPAEGMPLKEALDYAVQIAGGLAKAHAAGVIHRDLKPGNIMLSRDGLVKLLDFGLARRVELGPGRDATLTMEGQILGTPSYMSPEQAQGKAVDVRSDVFSFGSVLYEMVTGSRAFEKGSHMAAMAAVVEGEPRALPSSVPRDLERIIARCLRKDPAQRFQHMDDLKVDLEELKRESDSGQLPGRSTPEPRRSRRLLRITAIAAAALLMSAAVLIWRLRQTPATALKAVPLTSASGNLISGSFSPDGTKVAFDWNGEKQDNYAIYAKQIGASGPPVRLTTGPAAEYFPTWSPDDRWIAFFRQQPANWAIMLMPSLGGPQRKLAEIVPYSSLSWTPDAKWLAFSAGDLAQGPHSIWAIDVDTGERRRLTTFVTQSAGAGITLGDYSPSISPDGSSLAFARQVKSFVYELYVQRLTRDLRPEGEPVRVTDRRYPVVLGTAWTANGREIVYSAGSNGAESLWRVPVSGQRAPERLPYGLPAFAIWPVIARSPPRLVYTYYLWNENLWRLDTRTGERKMLIGSLYSQQLPDYSPDGRKIAFQSNRSGNMEVWTCDADGSTCTQITSFDGPACGTPRWSPDGRWLALDSRVEGHPEIYLVAADGGKPRRITDHPSNNILPSWSHDGLWIYFTSDRSGRYEVWKVARDGGEPVQVTRSGGFRTSESPDGKYLYHTRSPGTFSQGLFRMPAQGGEETQVIKGPVEMHFGVAAKGVYFQRDSKTIQFLDAASGKVRTIATTDKEASGLCVSPDEAYVVYGQTDRGEGGLMLVDGFR